MTAAVACDELEVLLAERAAGGALEPADAARLTAHLPCLRCQTTLQAYQDAIGLARLPALDHAHDLEALAPPGYESLADDRTALASMVAFARGGRSEGARVGWLRRGAHALEDTWRGGLPRPRMAAAALVAAVGVAAMLALVTVPSREVNRPAAAAQPWSPDVDGALEAAALVLGGEVDLAYTSSDSTGDPTAADGAGGDTLGAAELPDGEDWDGELLAAGDDLAMAEAEMLAPGLGFAWSGESF